ncbi:MAG TPA: hypothetical protein VKZ63_01615, partial [Kofleriaceae bacterium]|nr:hypothetical protein [Kofleriaceae bacterium]
MGGLRLGAMAVCGALVCGCLGAPAAPGGEDGGTGEDGGAGESFLPVAAIAGERFLFAPSAGAGGSPAG